MKEERIHGRIFVNQKDRPGEDQGPHSSLSSDPEDNRIWEEPQITA